MSVATKWYVLHVYSGFEAKVAEVIKEKARKLGLEEQVEEILVPTEEVVEVRRGQRVNSERKFFPGYVLAKLDLDDNVWHLIKDTPKVSGFLGTGGNRPIPISEKEAQRILQQVQEGIDRPRPSVVYDIGEEVKVVDGPFASFNGNVEDVDEEKAKLKVSVSIFGRATPVELEYSQVEKI
ncbi:MAG: transcription termination/antitermination protein NusG [Alphaproteobacteria bacterium]|nr:transcription termination/antitermination protein NusG [Alphaproteobacteria bacterium]